MICCFILQISDETILLDTRSFTTTKGPRLNEKRFSHDCVLIEDSGISVIYVAGGYYVNEAKTAFYHPTIETLRLTNDNFAENEWTVEEEIDNNVVLPNKFQSGSSKHRVLNRNGLQLVKSNAKHDLFYLTGGWEASNSNYIEQIWAMTRSKIWEPMESSLKYQRSDHQTLNVPSGSLKGC